MDGDEVYLYAISIAVDPRVKKPGTVPLEAELLLHALFEKLEVLAERKGVRVRSVVAVGWTPNGNRICSSILGMEKIGSDPGGHPIYRLDLDASLRKRKYAPLRHLCERYISCGLIAVPSEEIA